MMIILIYSFIILKYILCEQKKSDLQSNFLPIAPYPSLGGPGPATYQFRSPGYNDYLNIKNTTFANSE